jgi:hypothetical protein
MLRPGPVAVGAGTNIRCAARLRAGNASVRQRTNLPSAGAHTPGMNTLRPVAAGSRAKSAPERSDYLIDGFRVSFLHQADWKCDCREFGVAGTCRHTREAGGMRAAQSLIRRRLAGF